MNSTPVTLVVDALIISGHCSAGTTQFDSEANYISNIIWRIAA